MHIYMLAFGFKLVICNMLNYSKGIEQFLREARRLYACAGDSVSVGSVLGEQKSDFIVHY